MSEKTIGDWETIEKLNKEIDWEWQKLDALMVPFDMAKYAKMEEAFCDE